MKRSQCDREIKTTTSSHASQPPNRLLLLFCHFNARSCTHWRTRWKLRTRTNSIKYINQIYIPKLVLKANRPFTIHLFAYLNGWQMYPQRMVSARQCRAGPESKKYGRKNRLAIENSSIVLWHLGSFFIRISGEYNQTDSSSRDAESLANALDRPHGWSIEDYAINTYIRHRWII